MLALRIFIIVALIVNGFLCGNNIFQHNKALAIFYAGMSLLWATLLTYSVRKKGKSS